MKAQILTALDNLDSFTAGMKSLQNNPYSNGINTDKLLQDLEQFAKDMRAMVELIEEVSVDFEGEPDRNEEKSDK